MTELKTDTNILHRLLILFLILRTNEPNESMETSMKAVSMIILVPPRRWGGKGRERGRPRLKKRRKR
jgi:hypothetical protein